MQNGAEQDRSKGSDDWAAALTTDTVNRLSGFNRLALLAVAVVVCVNVYGLWAWWFAGGSLFRSVRLSYDGSTLVFPVLLVAVGAYGLLRWRRFKLRRRLLLRPVLCFVFAVLFFGLRIYATHIEPYQLTVRQAELPTDAFARTVRLLHISDIQSESVGSYEAEAFEQMVSLTPDLVLHTGDLLQPQPPATYQSELPAIAELLAKLQPSLGKFNVLGDTDGPIAKELSQDVGGFVTLVNEAANIEKQGQWIRLFGLGPAESHNPHRARKLVERWLSKADAGAFTIVMGHAPDFVLTMKDLPIHLFVAGHTHGGQIRLPGLGALITLSQVPRDWARGLRPVGKGHLNVSAGIGAEHAGGLPALRFNCPPEMTLLTLSPSTNPNGY